MSIWAEYLLDPQAQNSYSYARGNPLRFSDPTCEFAMLVPALGYTLAAYSAAEIAIGAYDTYITNFKYPGVFSSAERAQSRANLARDVALTGIGFAATQAGFKGYALGLDALDATFGDNGVSHHSG